MARLHPSAFISAPYFNPTHVGMRTHTHTHTYQEKMRTFNAALATEHC